MLQSIVCICPLIGIHNQQLLYQVYDLWGTRFEFHMVEVEVASRYFVENFVPILALEWQVTAHKNIKQYAY